MTRPVRATYLIKSPNPLKAASAIALGQSIGHPTIRTPYDATLIPRYGAKFELDGNVLTVEWPPHNFGEWDGLNHLMSVLMGGQTDIDLVEECRLVDLDLGDLVKAYPAPRYGMEGIRRMLGIYHRPLVGGIIKPKLGLTPGEVGVVAKAMADGGCNFIKDDEILGNPEWCPRDERVQKVAEALKGYPCIYAPCITSDAPEHEAFLASQYGATALHLNIWCGLGAYSAVRREANLPLFFQKSGDKVWTTGPYSIKFSVILQLARLAGCDFAHIGMYGGYMHEDEETLAERMGALAPSIPSFSCGMDPHKAIKVRDLFGIDLMVTSGGWAHGHPQGIEAGFRELTRAIQ